MYVRVHAVPNAKKERVQRESDTVFQISVREPAEQNRANSRIREIVAEFFKVSVGQVRILTGHRSRTKMLDVEV